MAAELEEQFAEKAKSLIRAEMDRKGMTYGALSDAMSAIGLPYIDEATLRSRMSRGKFSAAFMLICLHATGAKSVELE